MEEIKKLDKMDERGDLDYYYLRPVGQEFRNWSTKDIVRHLNEIAEKVNEIVEVTNQLIKYANEKTIR